MGGEEGVFCDLRVAKVSAEQEHFASEGFVAPSISPCRSGLGQCGFVS